MLDWIVFVSLAYSLLAGNLWVALDDMRVVPGGGVQDCNDATRSGYNNFDTRIEKLEMLHCSSDSYN